MGCNNKFISVSKNTVDRIMMWSAEIRDSQFFLVQLCGSGVTVPLSPLIAGSIFLPTC